jgi:ABC-type antimicrobial peptide transport system permease subunit
VLASSAFRFAAVADGASAGASPWHALGPADADGIVPAIADATSLQYALHASVGDVITVDADAARPLRLRIVAALADSMLQSEIVIADDAFTALFPERAGYRVLFVSMPGKDAGHLDELTRALERRLEPVGLDVRRSADRLESFHQVENTYISTFQMLGGLGLALGTIGLAAVTARSVVERRRELALLAASGYAPRHLQILIASEQIALVSAGIVAGVAASVVALVPVFTTSADGWPRLPLLWLAVVFVVGVASSVVVTRAVGRLPLLASLRGD